jgi:hypothetical protein
MKISDVIKTLEEIKEREGDLPCLMIETDIDYTSYPAKIKEFKVTEVYSPTGMELALVIHSVGE